jgi:hypothetical protein
MDQSLDESINERVAFELNDNDRMISKANIASIVLLILPIIVVDDNDDGIDDDKATTFLLISFNIVIHIVEIS